MEASSGWRTPPGWSGRFKRQNLILGMLILLALALRLALLTFQPLWWDEGWSVYFAVADIRSMLDLTAVDIHPPLYYALLHLWIGLLGSSVFSIKALSVLIGTATVPVLFVTGRWLWGTSGGLLAAALLAISPFHIYYSQEVRMYVLVTLLGLAAFGSALRWRQQSGDRISDARYWRSGLAYILAATLALYTQYYALYLLLALNISMFVCWLSGRRGVRRILPWLGAQVAVALLYLPWLWYAGTKLITYVRFKVSVEGDPAQPFFAYLGRHLAAFSWGHAEGPLASWWWLGLIPLAALVVCGCLVLWQRRGREGTWVAGAGIGDWLLGIGHWPLAAILVVLLCGFVVNLFFPFSPVRSERLLLLALPAYLLLVAGALQGLWRGYRSLAGLAAASYLVASILSLAFFYTVPRYPEDDYRPLAARLQALALPADAVIAVHPWQVGYLQAYIPDADARPRLILTPREVLPRERQIWADDLALMEASLDALLAESGRIWLVDHQAMARVLERQIEATLVERAYPVLSEWYGENTVLSLFSAGDQAALPVSAQLGEWLVLEGASLNRDPVQAGWGIVTSDLDWRLLERPDERYHVGLRLVDGAGRIWAQRDAAPAGGLRGFSQWPVGELHSDAHGLLVPAGTPPGEYKVVLRVYRTDDLGVLPVTSQGGSGGEVTLGSVQVVRPQISLPAEALEVGEPLEANFGDVLRLEGFSTEGKAALWPGETVGIDLFWQALADPGQDYLPRLQLHDASGVSVAERVEKPVAGTYPTAWWQAGDLVRDPHELPIPATVPPGRYRLKLDLIRAEDGQPVEIETGGESLELFDVLVEGREHNYQPTTPAHSQQAPFGPSVELMGYDLREAVRAPGSPLEVTLHWHVLETPDKAYHSFVHLLDAGGEIVAQHDGPPGTGDPPALGWLPSEYLTDTHLLQIPSGLPDGVYRLGVGLYDPATGQRLGERLLLDTPVPVNLRDGCSCP